MANILKRREAGTSQGYNGFDLSHQSFFTSAPGMILPIHWDKLQPKDKIRISTDMFSRLQPTNSASPLQISNHVDYFFIPYRLLFSLMPSMLADVNDWHSTLMERFQGNNLEDYPHFQLDYAFLNSVCDFELPNQVGPPRLSGLPSHHTLDWFLTSSELGSRTLLQLFDFGDFGLDYANSFFDQFKHIPNPDNPGHFLAWAPDNGATFFHRYYDVFPLLAYQCVWQWFYRLDTRQELDRDTYNCDKYYNQVPVSDVLPWTSDYAYFNEVPFLKLRYRPWKRDYFTSNEISPLGSNGSFSHYRSSGANSSFTRYIRQWLDDMGLSSYLVSAPDGGVTNTGSPTNSTEVSWQVPSQRVGEDEDVVNYQTTQQHRIAAVMEKLSAIWQQTGKTYKDQIEKQFGVTLDKSLSSRPIYIGSESSSFDMKPIVADVETEQMPAGTITGYGVASNKDRKPIEFVAPEHGIFLALYSSVPEAVYRPIGLDFAHTYQTRADYPLPVTDELGQRPLFGFEVANTSKVTDANRRLGWLARHQELKLKQDKRYLGFDTTLAYWIPARTSEAYANDLQSYYIRPNYLDDIMLAKYQLNDDIEELTHGWLDDAVFDGHPILNFFNVHCFKSSKQSTYGVPQNFFG